MADLEFQFKSALSYFKAESYQKSLGIFESLRAQKYPNPKLDDYLGLNCHFLGQFKKALSYYECYSQAIESKNDVLFFNNWGLLYQDLKQFKSAEKMFLKALDLALTPGQCFHIQKNLNAIYRVTNQYGLRLPLIRSLYQFEPDPLYILELASCFFKLRDYLQAQKLFAEYLHLPSSKIHLKTQMEVQICLARCLLEMGELSASLRGLSQLNSFFDPLLNWVGMLWVPIFFASKAERRFYLNQWSETLTRSQSEVWALQDPLSPQLFPPFYLTYHGREDTKEILEIISSKFRAALGTESRPLKKKPLPKRLGIASSNLKDHSIMDLFLGLFEFLGQEYTLYFYALGNPYEDQVTCKVKELATSFEYIPEDLKRAKEMILNDRLEILIYPEIGNDLFTYLLAHERLAPTQCTMTGVMQTSGISTIDYYLASEVLVPKESISYFSEKVFRAKAPVAAQMGPINISPLAFDGPPLVPEKNYYLCPMGFYKLSLEMDEIFKALLAEDEAAVIVLLQRENYPINQKIKNRIEGHLGELSERLQVYPWQNRAQFLDLLSKVDLVLDSYPVGGGNTLFQALQMGAPVISWVGPQICSRGTATVYAQGNLDMCLADSQSDYIQKAVQLVNDPLLNQEVKAELSLLKNKVFHNSDYSRELLLFFESLSG